MVDIPDPLNVTAESLPELFPVPVGTKMTMMDEKTVQIAIEEQIFEPAQHELLPDEQDLLLIGGGEQNGVLAGRGHRFLVDKTVCFGDGDRVDGHFNDSFLWLKID
jgi:hypothetical protein